MLLITLVMLIVGYVFWTYWEQPTAAQIATANAEIDSLQVIIDKRSEERRVGKECRYRWTGGHEKKKKHMITSTSILKSKIEFFRNIYKDRVQDWHMAIH